MGFVSCRNERQTFGYHFKIYGAMFLGQYRPALAAAEEMIATLPSPGSVHDFSRAV